MRHTSTAENYVEQMKQRFYLKKKKKSCYPAANSRIVLNVTHTRSATKMKNEFQCNSSSYMISWKLSMQVAQMGGKVVVGKWKVNIK